MTTKSLNSEHEQHLLGEGFTLEQIDTFALTNLIRSASPEDAYKAGFSVAIEGEPVTGGLVFQFSPTFSQIRLDNPNIIPKDRSDSTSKYAKYLSLGGAIDRGCAYIPDDCKAVTEGMKDALAFTYIGGIPTGAVAGVSQISKALPKNCGYTIVFDADAWGNFEVFKNLIRGGVHCGGKVAIVPEIENEPKAGGCEYFKAGNTADDYHQLLENAQTPTELFEKWFNRQEITDVTSASTLAVNAGKLLGEICGYATATAVDTIKSFLKTTRLSEWNLTVANILRDSGNTQASKNSMLDDEERIDTVQTAIDIAKARANLFHSPAPDSFEYAQIPSKTGVLTTHLVSSPDFRKWLNGEVYRETGRGLTGESMNTALATINAIASYDSPELPVSERRIVELNGRYYLYLADEQQTVIEYSAVGWSICTNSPVKFVFDRYKAALPIPRRDGKIDKLWDLVRIPDPSDRLAVASILVKVLVPEGGDPILALSGYAGSGKTTSANYLRSLIDPFTKGHVLAKIPDLDHLAIHGRRRRIIAIDNLSHITAEQSNILCGVSTKTSTTKRTLFTDGDETPLDVGNLVILTSIGNVVNKSDLLSRSINIELSKLTDDTRTSESKLRNDFDKYHGEMLGGLLNMAVYALNYRDTTKSPTYNRMTEFIHLGGGVEQYLEYTEGTLKKRIELGESEANTIAIESSPTASIILEWMNDKGTWEGSMSELLNTLKSHAKKSEQSGLLPKNAIKLSAEIRMVESALLEGGITIATARKNTGVYITLSNSTIGVLLSTLSTPSPEDKPRDSFRGVDKSVDKIFLSTPLSTLSTPTPKGVDRNAKSVDKIFLSTPLSTPLEDMLSNIHSDRVDSVDSNPPIIEPEKTLYVDDEYPYIDGDV